jgi:hypothetical protein
VIAAALVAAVLVAGGAVWVNHRDGDGGLPHADPHTLAVLPAMDPSNTNFSLGSLYINAPGQDVEVLSVEPLTSTNVEYLGAFTVWPRDMGGADYSFGPGFPAPEQPHRHPAIGVVVPAAETAAVPPDLGKPLPLTVTTGYRIRSGDFGAVNGVRVTCRAGGHTHSQLFRIAVVACVKPNPCGTRPGQDHFGDDALAELGLAPKR